MTEDWAWLEVIQNRVKSQSAGEQLFSAALQNFQSEQLIACIKEMRSALENSRSSLDSVKYELAASVYTLTDDEFEPAVFGTRDLIDQTLVRCKEGDFK
jgi:hypothetical protein